MKILLTAALVALPIGVSAQQCYPRAIVVDRLAERYSETRQMVGLAGNGSMVEVFASEETGTWTITVTAAGGATCMVSSGQAYQYLNEPLILGKEG